MPPRPPKPSNLIRTVNDTVDWSVRVSKPLAAWHNHGIEELLARPSWSVYSLLPPGPQPTTTRAAGTADSVTTANEESVTTPRPDQEVTREKLHHLLKLSALPLPKSQAEESRLLSSLRSQVHFVKAIQSVDTTDVKPLVAIRDETAEAAEEQTVGLKDLQAWLDVEEKVGQNGTVRRSKFEKDSKEGKIGKGTWDPFQLGVGSEEGSGRRVGRWFVVKKAKKEEQGTINGVGTRAEAKVVADVG